MSKNLFYFILIILVGTLLGAFIGKVIYKIFPSDSSFNSTIKELLSIEIKPGIHPTTIDLGILDFTIGVVLKLNITAVIGLVITAIIFRKLIL